MISYYILFLIREKELTQANMILMRQLFFLDLEARWGGKMGSYFNKIMKED